MTDAPPSGIKADEAALWAALLAGELSRDAGVRLGIANKRVVYLCTKWSRQRRYEWGTCADLGWVVDTRG